MKRALFALVLCLSAVGASAQSPPTESVTVSAGKTREAVDAFVKSVTAPTRITGKTARWETPICPYIVGVQPNAIAHLTQRLKEVAAEVGAPFNDRKNCRPNLQVIFNQSPDTLMQDVKVKMPWVLGYYDNVEERDQMAAFDHPIKAWYRTATRDVRGRLEVDRLETFRARKHINGSRLNDGLETQLYSVLLVANPDLLKDRMIETVSDAIAMLALAPSPAGDTCQNLPSVTDLLSKNCAHVPAGLTINDLGYLRGVYGAHAGLVSHLQKNEIANQMEKTLEGR